MTDDDRGDTPRTLLVIFLLVLTLLILGSIATCGALFNDDDDSSGLGWTVELVSRAPA
jgi:amino acid transporter